MSAYAHQMEREFSAQSLSSSENSESRSQYITESGFYMTSFAGTIFIGALVTTGVLFITLLIALSAMLQSCENRNAGILETHKTLEYHDYCKLLALHADLNDLEPASLPLSCADFAVRYVRDGEYVRELNFMIQMAVNHFDSITPQEDGLDVVLMDLDMILGSSRHPSSRLFPGSNLDSDMDYMKEAGHQKSLLTLELYSKLRSRGYSQVLLSRKPERYRNTTTEQLQAAGYAGWSLLVMRLDHEMELDSYEYFTRRRAAMHKGGFRIAGVIGNRMDILTGPCLGMQVFKLPNPLYYSSKDCTQRRKLL